MDSGVDKLGAADALLTEDLIDDIHHARSAFHGKWKVQMENTFPWALGSCSNIITLTHRWQEEKPTGSFGQIDIIIRDDITS